MIDIYLIDRIADGRRQDFLREADLSARIQAAGICRNLVRDIRCWVGVGIIHVGTLLLGQTDIEPVRLRDCAVC